MRAFTRRWRLDEVYVKIGARCTYLWRAVDHEGKVLKSLATKDRDKAAALKFMKKLMKRHGKGTGASDYSAVFKFNLSATSSRSFHGSGFMVAPSFSMTSNQLDSDA